MEVLLPCTSYGLRVCVDEPLSLHWEAGPCAKAALTCSRLLDLLAGRMEEVGLGGGRGWYWGGGGLPEYINGGGDEGAWGRA